MAGSKDSPFSHRRPSSLRDMDPEEIAWLAGWLEGEGTFGVQPGGYPKIAAASVDLDVLERAYKLTHVGRISQVKKQQEHHQQCWVWQVSRINDTVPLLEAILPFMMERRAARIRQLLEAV